jgi:hypothetical protein
MYESCYQLFTINVISIPSDDTFNGEESDSVQFDQTDSVTYNGKTYTNKLVTTAKYGEGGSLPLGITGGT